jgi:nicotinate-nucleotide pyrophosphorylase (carboxylating)
MTRRLPDLNSLPLDELYEVLSADGLVDDLLRIAVREDLGDAGDVTSRVIRPGSGTITARIIAREAGILAGIAVLGAIRSAFEADIEFEVTVSDGDAVTRGDVVAALTGSPADILSMERTTLNLIGRLSGIATLTDRFVNAIAGTRARIYDTRKTTPGWRRLEKYAVRCGGGFCHRLGLHDAVLVKDNHIAGVPIDQLTDVLRATIDTARRAAALRFVMVEVDTLEQFDAVLALGAAGPDIVLLDNMSPDELAEATRRRDGASSMVQLEASGGVRLETIRAIASSGVDRISVGAITHSAMQLDFGLDLPLS